MLSPKTKIEIIVDYPFQKMGDNIVLLDQKGGRSIDLNETASFVWESLKSPASLEELSWELSSEFEIDYDDALEDITYLINRFLKLKLINCI